MSFQRQHTRVNFFDPVKVSLDAKDNPLYMFAANLSSGGMFLRSNRPLPEGTTLGIRFDSQQGPVVVEEGEVVWQKRFEPINVDGTVPGMGVRFKKLTNPTQKIIKEIIDLKLSAAEECLIDQTKTEGLTKKLPPEPVLLTKRTEKKILSYPAPYTPLPLPVPTPVVHETPQDYPEPIQDKTPGFFSSVSWVITGTVLLAAASWLLLHQIQASHTPVSTISKPEAATETTDSLQDNLLLEPASLVGHKSAKTSVARMQKHQLSAPTFSKSQNGWKMTIKTGKKTKVKWFRLGSPNRLVFDFLGAEFSSHTNPRLIEDPMPMVHSVRIGRQPNSIRYVLDFGTDEILNYNVRVRKSAVRVFFQP